MTVVSDQRATVLDLNPMVELERDQCLRLVDSRGLGRIAITYRALPVIMPVAYRMLDGAPVFRVGPGVVHDAASNDAVCCFEVDEAAHDWSSAWSVVMIGRVHVIDDPETLARAAQLGLPAWPAPPGHGHHYIRLVPEIITGRAINP